MESYTVIWNNKEVGQLIDPMPDMWYLDGNWKSNDTRDSARFEQLLRSLDARQVMSDLSKGLEIVLRNNGEGDFHAIAISLSGDNLFLRRMTLKASEERGVRKG